MMLADKVSADEACQMGMIYKVFEAQHFEKQVQELVQKLAGQPPQALALIKRALNGAQSNDLREQLELEAGLKGMLGQTNDFREGVLAFVEKRKPNFTGR